MNRPLLDWIIDAIDRESPQLLVVSPPPCENPQLPGVVSWRRGCRCRRCDDASHSSEFVERKRRLKRENDARNREMRRWR